MKQKVEKAETNGELVPCLLPCLVLTTNKVGQYDLDDPAVQFCSSFLPAWPNKWCGPCMQKARVKLANNIVRMV